MIGPHGYCADVSRTFLCGESRPSGEQRRLYGLAWEQIHVNMQLLQPGLGFRELAERSWPLPASCRANRYSVVAHGVGICDESTAVVSREDFDAAGYDGVFLGGTAICVSRHIAQGGGQTWVAERSGQRVVS